MESGAVVIRPVHSMLRTDDLRAAVVRKFGIDPIVECRLQRSFINDVYRLEADGQIWFLRISPSAWRTAAEVAAEIDCIRALAAVGAPVIEPVKLADGSGFVLELAAPEGPRAAALFAGVAGVEPLFTNNPDALAVAHRYGRVSAELHVLAQGLAPAAERPSMSLDTMLLRPLAIVAAQFERTQDREDLTRIGERLIAALLNAKLTWGFAHGDLNSSNILFRDVGATVIDFDCCGWGFRANDIAAFARGITLSCMPGSEASALISAQLSGYVEVSPIQPADADAIPLFVIVQRLWMASLHYERQDRFGLASFGPAYTARLIEWLRAWEIMLDAPPDWLAAAKPK